MFAGWQRAGFEWKITGKVERSWLISYESVWGSCRMFSSKNFFSCRHVYIFRNDQFWLLEFLCKRERFLSMRKFECIASPMYPERRWIGNFHQLSNIRSPPSNNCFQYKVTVDLLLELVLPVNFCLHAS